MNLWSAQCQGHRRRQHRTELKGHTHPIRRQKLKFLTPPGIEPGRRVGRQGVYRPRHGDGLLNISIGYNRSRQTYFCNFIECTHAFKFYLIINQFSWRQIKNRNQFSLLLSKIKWSTISFGRGIQKLVPWYDKCLYSGGEYVKKYRSSTVAISFSINIYIKFDFLSVNDPRETYFVHALRNVDTLERHMINKAKRGNLLNKRKYFTWHLEILTGIH